MDPPTRYVALSLSVFSIAGAVLALLLPAIVPKIFLFFAHFVSTVLCASYFFRADKSSSWFPLANAAVSVLLVTASSIDDSVAAYCLLGYLPSILTLLPALAQGT